MIPAVPQVNRLNIAKAPDRYRSLNIKKSLIGEMKRKKNNIVCSRFDWCDLGAGSLITRTASNSKRDPKHGFFLDRSQRLISLGSDTFLPFKRGA